MPELVPLAGFVAFVLGAALAPAAARAQRRSARPAQSEEIVLLVGEQTTLPAENVRSYSVGRDDVIDVRVTSDGKQFVIAGLREGRSSLLLIYRDGSQRRYQFRVVRELQRQWAVAERPNIRLDFYFVELSENSRLSLGIGWPTVLGAQVRGEVGLNFGAQTADMVLTMTSELLPRLDLLQSWGWAKLRRHAAVVTANGEAAEFVSGGEVYVALRGVATVELAKIPFGSHFRVTPRYDPESGLIEIRIDADVSELGEPFEAGGLPSRARTRTSAVLNLKLGEALVVGGLQAESQQHARTGLPGLSQIPILGILFGQHTWQRRRTENVLIILPTVRQRPPGPSTQLVEEALRLYRRFDGDLEELEALLPAPQLP